MCVMEVIARLQDRALCASITCITGIRGIHVPTLRRSGSRRQTRRGAGLILV